MGDSGRRGRCLDKRTVVIKLQTVKKPGHLVQARTLFRQYAETRRNDPALVEFPEEIKNLPGEYGPPDGCIMLAHYRGNPAGCVALHKIADGICEMKRLYVSPLYRGNGIGKSLVEAVLSRARELGYSRMRLDSIPGMETAQALYESVGFYDIDAYRNNPNRGTKYYEIELARIGGQ